MKGIKYIFFIVLLITSISKLTAQTTDFVTTWKTNNTGTSASNQITIPTTGTGYDYDVNWGDSTIDTAVTGNITHTYNTAGTYTVRISGAFPQIYFNEVGDSKKILSVEQWGSNMHWATFNSAFNGCINLILNATDLPDLSGVTDVSQMFSNCLKLNQGNFNSWDMHTIVNMSSMFYNAVLFNQPIGNWNTANVTNMSSMLSYAKVFNQPIGNWNTTNVTNMNSMFLYAQAFNQPINNWNTTSVTDMSFMFYGSWGFNKPVGNWNTGKVATMLSMFNNAFVFNQSLENWNTVNTTNMSSMFSSCYSFNQPLGNWNISKVTNMNNMLKSTGLTLSNYDSTLIGWNNQPHLKNVIFGADGLKYCASANAHTSLINNDKWVITGDTLKCPVPINTTDFVTTWQTNQSINGQQITIPTSGGGYNYNVNWGDGTTSNNVTGNITHPYANPGTYTIRISGSFPQISLNEDNAYAIKLLSIEQWGSSMKWKSFLYAFYNCFNLVINATDTPDLSDVTNVRGMFMYCTKLQSNLSGWDTHTITNMSEMFYGANLFDQNLGSWNISHVQNMTDMFNFCGLSLTNYDSTLIGWYNQPHLTNVTLGASGVEYCKAYSAHRSLVTNDGWIISDYFECPPTPADFVTKWNTNNAGISLSNQIAIPTTDTGYNYTVTWGDGTIDSNVIGNITHTYPAPGTYTVRISGTFPRIYFNNTGDRKKILSVEQWGTDMHWRSFASAFAWCENLVINATDAPDLSGVTNLSSMFSSCVLMNSSLNTWNTSNITNMSSMFASAHAFNKPLYNWNTSNVTNMSSMFAFASAFNQVIYTWNTVNWNTAKVTDMSNMFYNASLFNQNISNWNTTNVTNMNNMFNSAVKFNQNIGTWNTAKVTNMSSMFFEDDAFNQPIGNWNTDNVTDMHEMFKYASVFNQDITNWNTRNVTDMSNMFSSSYAFNQNIGNWNTENVTDMNNMFAHAVAFDQPIGNWKTSNVINMNLMFYRAYAFNQDIGNWNTANVTNMGAMFGGTNYFNQNISNWNTGKVTTMHGMFSEARAFNQSLGKWDISNVTAMDYMLNSSGMNSINYDSTLIGWNNNPHPKNITLRATGLKYCTSATAHASLIGYDKWTIIGDAILCPANSNTFVFTGNGNWTSLANWINTGVPLNDIPPGSTILIDPVGNGVCVVDVPVYIPTGVSVTVAPNKKLLIMGNLIIQ
ncbi:MAG: BspA family leucine-rich repeat surface protein [Bacteroidota bacterium]